MAVQGEAIADVATTSPQLWNALAPRADQLQPGLGRQGPGP